MAQKIIGREQESKEIEALYQESKPVFAVIYGRRRVGKHSLSGNCWTKNLPSTIQDCRHTS